MTRDDVLDKILGRKGSAKNLRRIPDAISKALESEGVQHKALKTKGIHEQMQGHLDKITDDPELKAKIHGVMAKHMAEKAGIPLDDHEEPDGDEGEDGWDDEEGQKESYMGMDDMTKEDSEGDEEAEDEEGEEDRRSDEKAQPGYEEMDQTNPVMTPALVNSAITKKPGNFSAPVTHQERTGKAKSISENELRRVVKALDKRLSDIESALGEVAEFVEIQKTNSAFSPRQASISPETAVTDKSLTESVRKMNGRFDSFWGSNVQGGN